MLFFRMLVVILLLKAMNFVPAMLVSSSQTIPAQSKTPQMTRGEH